jgi:predicted dithiol-disulfide oxidoreductase (DUF899 family)
MISSTDYLSDEAIPGSEIQLKRDYERLAARRRQLPILE